MNQGSKIFDSCTPKTIKDIILMASKIIDAVECNPMDDKVFVISIDKVKDISITPVCCIAGSKAVNLFYKFLKLEKAPFPCYFGNKIADNKIAGDFECNDTDIFFMNSKEHHRTTCGDVDIIHIKESSVETLLLNFDLPCCRAATDDSEEIFWISAQCLYSMLTGQYFLPAYLKDIEHFTSVFDEQLANVSPNSKTRNTTNLFTRLQYRT